MKYIFFNMYIVDVPMYFNYSKVVLKSHLGYWNPLLSCPETLEETERSLDSCISLEQIGLVKLKILETKREFVDYSIRF